jgi:cold shock CspA family protein
VDGIIRSLKEGFGFIERADIASEIFFHFTEFDGAQQPKIGDGVRFEVITARQEKPIANNVRLVPEGVVVEFVEILPDERSGVVSRPCKKPRDRRVDPNKDLRNFGGMITILPPSVEIGEADAGAKPGGGAAAEDGDVGEGAVAPSKEESFLFGIVDVSPQNEGDPYAVDSGDTVSFSVAKDKRNGKKRAVNVQVTEKAPVIVEDKEEGVVRSVKDGFGFITCADRDAELFFHFSEVLSSGGREIHVRDNVKFAVEQQQEDRRSSSKKGAEKLHAVRVEILAMGAVKFEVTSTERFRGTVKKSAQPERGGFESRRMDRSGGGAACSRGNAPNRTNSTNTQQQADEATGLVKFVNAAGETKNVTFRPNDVTDMRAGTLYAGDEIEFNTLTIRRTGEASAIEIAVVKRAPPPVHDAAGSLAPSGTGAAAATSGAAESGPPEDLPTRGGKIGFVSSIKESFGFLEAASCDKEFFFHFSELQVKGTQLQVGDAITYDSTKRGAKLVAIKVALLPTEQRASLETVGEEILHGVINRTVRNDSKKYGGLIQYVDPVNSGATDGEAGAAVETPVEAATDDAEPATASVSVDASVGDAAGGGLSADDIHARLDAAEAESAGGSAAAAGAGAGADAAAPLASIAFGSSSMGEARNSMRTGDKVTFRVASWSNIGSGRSATRAVDVKQKNLKEANERRKKEKDQFSISQETYTAAVESVKGQFGFLAHNVESSDSHSLYYHGSSVHPHGGAELGPGDTVQFEISYHAAKDKHTAVNVRLISRKEEALVAERPARLARLLPKAVAGMGTTGCGFGTVRIPTIPDGTRGFSRSHRPSIPLPEFVPAAALSVEATEFTMGGV